MDTAKPSFDSQIYSCTPAGLAAQLRTSEAPLVIDVRKSDAFLASGYTVPGALRRDPGELGSWARTLPEAQSVLVYCVHGHEVSRNAMHFLRERGINASYLQGGIEAWHQQGFPVDGKAAGSTTRWITRERPKIDRIACPWLVRRFVDAQAQFLYVPVAELRAVALDRNAIPYDVSKDVAETRFTHEGERCSFDAFIKNFNLKTDIALSRLADIVRAADTDRLDLAAQAAGLLAVSLGMSRRHADDHAMLEAMIPVYDALYAWCRDVTHGQDEKHNWKPLEGMAERVAK